LFKLISKFSEDVSINNVALDGSFLIMLGKFFFVDFVIDGDSSVDCISLLFGNVGVLSELIFLLEVFPQLLPYKSNGSVNQD